MTKKSSKISVNKFEKAVKDMYGDGVCVVEWNGLNVEIKRTLSLRDAIMFSEHVVGSCFDDNGNYIPESYRLSVMNAMVALYTNISLPQSAENKYDLLCKSHICDVIASNVDAQQLEDIISIVKKRIKYIIELNNASAKREIEEICKSFDVIKNQIESTFSDISGEDIESITNLINSGVDQSAIAKAAIASVNSNK